MLEKQNKLDTSKGNRPDQGQFLIPSERRFLLERLQADLRPEYRRRIEIMLLADKGQSQTQICTSLQCSHETARYWISMVKAGQIHNWKVLPVGRPKTVNDQYLARLEELVSRSPREYGYSFRRWTARWLSKHLATEFDIEISDRHINRLLKQMGLSTRPRRFKAEKAANQSENTQESGIVVRNLPSASPPESLRLWLFNPNRDSATRTALRL